MEIEVKDNGNEYIVSNIRISAEMLQELKFMGIEATEELESFVGAQILSAIDKYKKPKDVTKYVKYLDSMADRRNISDSISKEHLKFWYTPAGLLDANVDDLPLDIKPLIKPNIERVMPSLIADLPLDIKSLVKLNIERVMPSLIAHDIVGVSPMTAPDITNNIFVKDLQETPAFNVDAFNAFGKSLK